jgi:hypothetical protein
LKSEGVAHPTKRQFGLNVLGTDAVRFDDFEILAARPNPAWPAVRDTVRATMRRYIFPAKKN